MYTLTYGQRWLLMRHMESVLAPASQGGGALLQLEAKDTDDVRRWVFYRYNIHTTYYLHVRVCVSIYKV